MQFKHLALKAKGSLFLILLVVVGIGVLVWINTGDDDKTESSKKRTTEVNSPVLEEENADSDPEPNVPTQPNGPSKPGSEGNKSTPAQNKPDFGTVDGKEYYNTFRGRVDVYENTFFGMKVNFPEEWTMEDKRYQNVLFSEQFDANKQYLFSSVVLDKPSPNVKLALGVRAEKYPFGALKFLEGIKTAKKYYSVSEIGPTGNQQTQRESISTEISEVIINNNKFFQLSIKQSEFGSETSYFVYPWKSGVIIFQIAGSVEANGQQMLKELLNGASFSKPESAQIEMP
ncbi:MAG: hypothetical protein K0R71_133 [Bacillales bacterium]|nr:hypothetical protein [Bacillales bacterium]